MTEQEVFDKVAVALVKQGDASTNAPNGGDCMYRGEYGRKCAVGHLLPDKAYHEDLEHIPVDDPTVLRALELDCVRLLSDLQKAHDNDLAKFGLDVWCGRMQHIAHKHDLSTDALDQAMRGAQA